MAQITKEQFDALPDTLKTEFFSDGDGYTLHKEDVEGLKKSKAEILAEKKRVQAQLDELSKWKAEQDAKAAEADEEKMKAAGEWQKLEEKYKAKIGELETGFSQKETQLLNSFKTERLKNELTARGVLADRAKYALADIAEQVELVAGDDGFSLKVKAGLGDPKEFDALIDGLKQVSPFFFAASTASGSGASGSGNAAAGRKTITRADYDKMSPVDLTAFFEGGGTVTD